MVDYVVAMNEYKSVFAEFLSRSTRDICSR